MDADGKLWRFLDGVSRVVKDHLFVYGLSLDVFSNYGQRVLITHIDTCLLF